MRRNNMGVPARNKKKNVKGGRGQSNEAGFVFCVGGGNANPVQDSKSLYAGLLGPPQAHAASESHFHLPPVAKLSGGKQLDLRAQYAMLSENDDHVPRRSEAREQLRRKRDVKLVKPRPSNKPLRSKSHSPIKSEAAPDSSRTRRQRRPGGENQPPASKNAVPWQEGLRPDDGVREKAGGKGQRLAEYAAAQAHEAYVQARANKEEEWAAADALKRLQLEAQVESAARREADLQRARKEAERVEMEAMFEEERKKQVASHLELMASDAQVGALEPNERAARSRAAKIALASVPKASGARLPPKNANQGRFEAAHAAAAREAEEAERAAHKASEMELEARRRRKTDARLEMAALKAKRADDLDHYLLNKAVEVVGSSSGLDTRLVRPTELASGRGAALPSYAAAKSPQSNEKLVPGVVAGGVVTVIGGQVYTRISPTKSQHGSGSSTNSPRSHGSGSRRSNYSSVYSHGVSPDNLPAIDSAEVRAAREAKEAAMLRRWGQRGRGIDPYSALIDELKAPIDDASSPKGTENIESTGNKDKEEAAPPVIQKDTERAAVDQNALNVGPPVKASASTISSTVVPPESSLEQQQALNAVKSMDSEGSTWIGRSVLKDFEDYGLFKGSVTAYAPDTQLWTVLYEDGDEEELTREELAPLLEAAAASSRVEAPADAVPIQPIPATMPSMSTTTTTSSKEKEGVNLVGRAVAKVFEDYGLFRGKVTGPAAAMADAWTVLYEDGDEEDLTRAEIEAILVVPASSEETNSSCEAHAERRNAAESSSHNNAPAVSSPVEASSSVAAAASSTENTANLVGLHVQKLFDDYGTFRGEVTGFNPTNGLFTVVYEDGDEEELTRSELEPLIVEFLSTKKTHLQKSTDDDTTSKEDEGQEDRNAGKDAASVSAADVEAPAVLGQEEYSDDDFFYKESQSPDSGDLIDRQAEGDFKTAPDSNFEQTAYSDDDFEEDQSVGN